MKILQENARIRLDGRGPIFAQAEISAALSLLPRWEAQRFVTLAEMISYNVWQLGLLLVWLKQFELMSQRDLLSFA